MAILAQALGALRIFSSIRHHTRGLPRRSTLNDGERASRTVGVAGVFCLDASGWACGVGRSAMGLILGHGARDIRDSCRRAPPAPLGAGILSARRDQGFGYRGELAVGG